MSNIQFAIKETDPIKQTNIDYTQGEITFLIVKAKERELQSQKVFLRVSGLFETPGQPALLVELLYTSSLP